MRHSRAISQTIMAVVAVIFGLMTLKEGGAVLFFDGPARQAAGSYVGFVLWFNFIAGFFYIVTGLAIWWQQAWAKTAALTIAVLTLLVFAAFGLHILNGGAFEQRTVIAMSLRSSIWLAIAWGCYRTNRQQ